jgi:hypothetical protein
MDFPFQIFGVCTAEEYYAATTDWSQDFAVGCPVHGAFPRAGILDCGSKSNGSRAWNESEETKIKIHTLPKDGRMGRPNFKISTASRAISALQKKCTGKSHLT